MSERTRPTELERFWAKVDKTGDCWLWTAASVSRGGYGRFRTSGGVVLAHRYVLGVVDANLEVDHMCHVGACVRPEHLQVVTHKQNCENLAGAHRDSWTGVRGVSWDKARQRFRAQVMHNGRQHSVGRFATLEEAAEAASALRRRLHANSLMDRAS